jgi:hypothetical protein
MSVGIATRARGTVIKVPDVTPGLLIVNGQQSSFTLEGRWRSPVAPTPNMAVDVDFDEAGGIAAISVIDAQQIAKERLNQLGDVAQQQGKVAAEMARQGIGALAARMGTPTLVATAALWVAWFFLPAASIDVLFTSRSITFWQFLGFSASNLANGVQGSHGLFSVIGLLAIAAPFAVPYLVDPRAKYLNALPLAYLVLTPIATWWDIRRTLGSTSGIVQGVAENAASEIFDAISIGLGMYLIIAASLFLAVTALKR